MTAADILRMKEEQALRTLEVLDCSLMDSSLFAERRGGTWRAFVHTKQGGHQYAKGSTLLDALSQLAQVLTVDDPGPYDHEADTREPAERVAL